MIQWLSSSLKSGFLFVPAVIRALTFSANSSISLLRGFCVFLGFKHGHSCHPVLSLVNYLTSYGCCAFIFRLVSCTVTILGWDGWRASRAQWTRVWASSSSWWWTGRPGTLQSVGSRIVGHDWVAELTVTIAPGVSPSSSCEPRF